MLNAKDSLVLIIDIQEKLTKMLGEDLCRRICDKSKKLTLAAKTMGIDVLITEQYPKGLGLTIEEIKNTLEDEYKPVEKTYFNTLLEEGFLTKLKSYSKKQIVICGIEAHICVLQSAIALIKEGFEVYVVKDICASRDKFEFKSAMEYLKNEGAKICTLEMVLFMWLKGSKNPCFKEVQALIK